MVGSPKVVRGRAFPKEGKGLPYGREESSLRRGRGFPKEGKRLP
jgi:hypothetical protein